MYIFTSGKNHNKEYEPPKRHTGNRFGWTSTLPATESGNESKPESDTVNNSSTKNIFTSEHNNNNKC